MNDHDWMTGSDCPLCGLVLLGQGKLLRDPRFVGQTSLRAPMAQVPQPCPGCGQDAVTLRASESALRAALGGEEVYVHVGGHRPDWSTMTIHGPVTTGGVVEAEARWAAALAGLLPEIVIAPHPHKWTVCSFGWWNCKCGARVMDADRPPNDAVLQPGEVLQTALF